MATGMKGGLEDVLRHRCFIYRVDLTRIRHLSAQQRREISAKSRSTVSFTDVQPRPGPKLSPYDALSQTFTMSDIPAEPPKDSLGLDLDSLKITDDAPHSSGPAAEHGDTAAAAPSLDAQSPPTHVHDAPTHGEQPSSPAEQHGPHPTAAKERKEQYVNLERVKTGGMQRVCSGSG